MSKFTLAFGKIQQTTEPLEPEIPEFGLYVTGFVGDYEKYNGIPVQMEFVSRIDEKEFKKSKIGVSINKWMKTTKMQEM